MGGATVLDKLGLLVAIALIECINDDCAVKKVKDCASKSEGVASVDDG